MTYQVTKNPSEPRAVVALSKARNWVAAELDAGLKDVGINVQQLGILLTLARDNARSPIALAKLLGVDPGRMTRVLGQAGK
jgi:DNA-binding MarR family transcriptional regulator